MSILYLIPLVLVGVVALLFVWWRFFHIARPAVAPLSIAPDDSLMIEAVLKAKESIPRFRELAAQPNKGIRVKVPFVSSSGTTEHLWAEVLSFRDSRMEVRYLTPPVTHTGRLERLHSHLVDDLTDWQVELPSGRYAGGYTMRVMFARGRAQWGSLPPDLEAEEKKYESLI
jgi:uncharacterized protein YegJ (DUF2314 family)